MEIHAVSELDRAFETIVKRRADGVLRLGDALSEAVRAITPAQEGARQRAEHEWTRRSGDRLDFDDEPDRGSRGSA